MNYVKNVTHYFQLAVIYSVGFQVWFLLLFVILNNIALFDMDFFCLVRYLGILHCVHCRIDAHTTAWSENVDLITKIIKQELIAVFIQALHQNE